MATFTIKIDSEILARKVLTQMAYLDEEEEDRESVTETTEEIETHEITNSDIFTYLRSKGDTLDEVCEKDKEIAEFFAMFNVKPEQGIEPASGKSLGADLDYVQDSFNVTNACQKEIDKERALVNMNKDAIRAKASAIADDTVRFRFIVSETKTDSRVHNDAARELVFEFMANRKLEPYLITEMATINPELLPSLYQYKESEFLVKFGST